LTPRSRFRFSCEHRSPQSLSPDRTPRSRFRFSCEHRSPQSLSPDRTPKSRFRFSCEHRSPQSLSPRRIFSLSHHRPTISITVVIFSRSKRLVSRAYRRHSISIKPVLHSTIGSRAYRRHSISIKPVIFSRLNRRDGGFITIDQTATRQQPDSPL